MGAVDGDANVWKSIVAFDRVEKNRSWEPPLGDTETELIALGLRDRMHAMAPKFAYMCARPM